MADDNKLVVQIVLDDGSVVKGFAKIEQQAEKTAKNASSSFENFEDNFSVDGILNKIKSIGPAAGAAVAVATAAVAGLALAFDQALKGEKLEAMEKNFNNIAAAAGLSGKAIEAGLVAASDGMFDLSDNIGLINDAIINLGSSAEKLPQIMAIARKSAAASGGDFQANFTNIINAIESGNVRALRGSGIFIDANKALSDYAKTIGTTASQLDISQRQQALLNATIAEGEKKFKDVTTSATPMLDSMKRVAVAWDDIAEATQKATKSAFGDWFAASMERVAAAIGSDRSKITVLTADIEKLNKSLSETPQFQTTQRDFIQTQIGYKQAELDAINKSIDDAKKAAGVQTPEQKAELEAAFKADQAKRKALNDAQQAVDAQAVRDSNLAIMEGHQALLSAEQAQANTIVDMASRQYEQKRLLQEQAQLDLETHLFTVAGLQSKYDTNTIAGQAQLNAALSVEQDKYNAKKIANDMKVQQMEKVRMAYNLNAANTFFGTLAGLQDSGSREMFEVGKAAAIAQATISAYQGINKTLGEGGAWAVPQAIALGVMAFANVAKIAATNFGDKGSAPSSGGGLGGGINAGTTTPTDSPALANVEPTKVEPQSKIEVVIQGNVLNNRETSLHLVELLNEAFDQHGAVVTGMA